MDSLNGAVVVGIILFVVFILWLVLGKYSFLEDMKQARLESELKNARLKEELRRLKKREY